MELLLARIGTTRLKDLVRELRSCKTVAEERDVISRESAAIRTHLKEDDPYLRYINVSKLLYIHMIGYSSHFGQIECLKLAASQKFIKKRLGYLGVTLLVDNKDVLVLITNSLKRDLLSQNQYVSGLALSVLGDIATADIANDLYSEVENILSRGNPYLLKKAFLCAVRLVKKVPHLTKRFIPKVKNVLFDRDHGILLTGITLIIELCKHDASFLAAIRMTAVRELVKHFNNLIMSDTSHDYSIGGVADPFLQVKILQLLRILGKDHKEASDKMSDVLSQVATNANLQKNVVHSILYEAVLTIMEIESSKPLKLLSINILGNLLAVKDNNIRYVALVTLSRILTNNKREDIPALQHHSVTILECLHDPDTSIRKRALDLSFDVANPHNIKTITEKFISFIRNYGSDIKSSTIFRLCQCIDANSSNNMSIIEATCVIIDSAGKKVEDEIVHYLVKVLDESTQNLQVLATYWLYYLLHDKAPISYIKTALVKACLWCLGEYGDLAISVTPKSLNLDENVTLINIKPESFIALTERSVLEMVYSIALHTNKSADICCYVLTTAVKLSVKFNKPESMDAIKEIIEQFASNYHFEVQQRACEFYEILKLSPESRKRILSPLNHYPKLDNNEEPFQWNLGNRVKDIPISRSFSSMIGASKDIKPSSKDTTIRRDDTQQSLKAPAELLREIFDDDTTKPQDIHVPVSSSLEDRISKDYALFEEGLLKVNASVDRLTIPESIQQDSESKVNIKLMLSNNGNETLNNFQLKIAVPKYLKINLLPPGIYSIPAQGVASQTIVITNPKCLQLKIRVKIEYSTDSGGPVDILFEYSNFDSSLWE